MISSGRKRLPLEAPLMRVVATGGIVGTGGDRRDHDLAGLRGVADRLGGVDRVGGVAAVLWSSRRL
jgi:hypothetical protein